MVDSDEPAVPASRAVAMFVVVFAVLALIAAASWFVVRPTPAGAPCEADGRVGSDGQQLPWHRDPEQDCRWVDEDGNLVADQ